MKLSRRTVLQAVTAAIGALLTKSTVWAWEGAAEVRREDCIVRKGETVALAPGRYGRVVLEGGTLYAPSDVRIDELVFHSGRLAMPQRG